MEKRYARLQCKSAFSMYPALLLVTLITIFSIVITCVVLLQTNSANDEKKKFAIGVVGNTEDSYLDVGLSALETFDSSKGYLSFEKLSEEEAQTALKNRDISGYVLVPENYITLMLGGKNIPAKYVTLNAPDGFGTIISSEVAELASQVVTGSQTGVYAIQKLSKYYHKNSAALTDELALRYVDFFIGREAMYQITLLGVSDSLSFAGYYICGLLILFVLLLGITSNRIFASKNRNLAKTLNFAGIKPARQVICEYAAYLLTTLATLFLFAAVFGIVISLNHFNIPELKHAGFFSAIFFIIKILPVIVMITMMQTAIYELIPSPVPAILMQFIITMVLGYVSGCFYPNYFFPETVQNIVAFLPVGTGFSYIRKALSGNRLALDLVLNVIYIALFFGITVFSRKRKIEGDAK